MLCTAALFLALLQDRFRFWATLAVGAAAFLAAFLLGSLAGRLVDGPAAGQAAAWAGAVVFFVASLFIHTNNFAQKLFVLLLCPCCTALLELFLPLILGLMPFTVAGAPGAVVSAVLTVLLFLLMGLCLYRPFHHFSDRGPSLFVGGMCVLLCMVYLLCLGKADFLFPGNPPAGRLLLSTLLYGCMIFCFRSVYQAGRFRESAEQEAARRKRLEVESEDFGDMLAAVQEVRAAQKRGEYALDTVQVMLRDGVPEQIPAYIYMAKHNAAQAPILTTYHENPYLNAVIATKAAFAAQHDIDFQCNAAVGNVPLKTAELCMMFHEMLTRACREAVGYDGEKRLRFTAIPGEDSLRLEAVYTADPPPKPDLSPRGLGKKKLSDVLVWLFEDSPGEERDLMGLENTAETVLLHSGRLAVSSTPGETILQAELRF